MEPLPTPDYTLILQEISSYTQSQDYWFRVFLQIVVLGIGAFVAWKIWTRALYPIIKTYIKFPL